MKISFDDEEIMTINKVAEESGIDGFDLIESYQETRTKTLLDDIKKVANHLKLQ